jgi:hypothetical protein
MALPALMPCRNLSITINSQDKRRVGRFLEHVDMSGFLSNFDDDLPANNQVSATARSSDGDKIAHLFLLPAIS